MKPLAEPTATTHNIHNNPYTTFTFVFFLIFSSSIISNVKWKMNNTKPKKKEKKICPTCLMIIIECWNPNLYGCVGCLLASTSLFRLTVLRISLEVGSWYTFSGPKTMLLLLQRRKQLPASDTWASSGVHLAFESFVFESFITAVYALCGVEKCREYESEAEMCRV